MGIRPSNLFFILLLDAVYYKLIYPELLKMTEPYTNITLLLLPNQLFEPALLHSLLKPYITTSTTKANKPKLNIILLEHPVFFGYRKPYGQMKFNKLKLLYQMSAVRYYTSETLLVQMQTYFTPGNITLITDEHDWTPILHKQLKTNQCQALFYIDPVDNFISKQYETSLNANHHPGHVDHPYIELDNPAFINSKADLEAYHKTKPNPDSYTHAGFYKYQRQKTGILPGTKTYDTENRDKLPDSVDVPKLPENINNTPEIRKILDAVKTLIEEHGTWSKFPGTCDPNALQFPISRPESLAWLTDFYKHKFAKFGKYQDAIAGNNRNFLFHSCISPMLNTGLITPDDVLKSALKYKAKVPIQAFEGFIRQVIGWREYQRYIYIYIGENIRKTNLFNNKAKLTDAWYTGDTGILPVDDAIKMAFKDGYLHHILRLMVMGNIMNLVGIHPDDVYKWFMEFALDSYDWVMVGNVYSMALWADGGLTMRKPYISSSAYILKMSTYKRGEWADIWDNAFHGFINRNSTQLNKTYYAGIVKAWTHKKNTDKHNITKKNIAFLKGIINKS